MSNLTNVIMYNNTSERPLYASRCPLVEHHPTKLRITELSESGQPVVNVVCLELRENPFTGLSYTDFSLQTLLRNGVDLRHLAIQADTRLGIDDSMLDMLNGFYTSKRAQLFDLKDGE